MDAAESPPPLVVKSEGDCETVVDVSEKSLELSVLGRRAEDVKGLYIYKNSFNLIPGAVGAFGGLRTLKFFANEINVLPPELGNLVELEFLQVKVSSPRASELPFQKLKSLKELELRKVPARFFGLSILTEIANLKDLRKLTVCHFSIRYIPPEIGCLKNLEHLDLSFNKLKCLPNDIASLSALRSLRIANNKLEELPFGLSCLQMLENLDLSNNRLSTLGPLKLSSMHSLRTLNLQFNKLLSCCQIPSWICCNLEGSGVGHTIKEVVASVIEVDASDESIPHVERNCFCEGRRIVPSTHLLSEPSSSNSRCSVALRPKKGWKRRDLFQRRARQERLNNSRKCKGDNSNDLMNMQMVGESIHRAQKECLNNSRTDEGDSSSDLMNAKMIEESIQMKQSPDPDEDSGESDSEVLSCHTGDDIIDYYKESKEEFSDSVNYKCDEVGKFSACSLDKEKLDMGLSSEKLDPCSYLKPKRHSERDLDNPKPSKCRRPVGESLNISRKYSEESFCGFNDRLPDGFYDAGRDRRFMSLDDYEECLSFDSREVILVDRGRDEELDALALSAHVLVSRLNRSRNSFNKSKDSPLDDLQRASLLALFVSDCFGGSDRINTVVKIRKAVAGSIDQKPFVCTCSSQNNEHGENSSSVTMHGSMRIFNLNDLCNRSLRFIKETSNSNIVPIGSLRYGLCRHRALLLKYLCDRADPPIPCELVRGYLDFMPHAWNAILLKKSGGSCVRMIVDACHPTDIRDETDPEYFHRYIPLTRVHNSVGFETSACSFPSVSFGDRAEKSASRSVIKCKFGKREAAAKVRTFVANGCSDEDTRDFEYSCLGEVRLLGVFKNHNCIVEIFGHRLLSKWAASEEGTKECQILQLKIMMEYVKGGSLKRYLEKLSQRGEKHVPVKTALAIARDVACALVEVHSKLVIHRDIKSENVLIDLDNVRTDGTPTVKLCDFDRAVPLESSSHNCCIRHFGVAPPNACVGTPNWMAPEVFRAMHTQNRYGLEVDIWSFGCLILELLTLQIPYAAMLPSEINHLLENNQRPPLPGELKDLVLPDEPRSSGPASPIGVPEADAETLKILVNLFYECTRADPADRPKASSIYDTLRAAVSSYLPNVTSGGSSTSTE